MSHTRWQEVPQQNRKQCKGTGFQGRLSEEVTLNQGLKGSEEVHRDTEWRNVLQEGQVKALRQQNKSPHTNWELSKGGGERRAGAPSCGLEAMVTTVS